MTDNENSSNENADYRRLFLKGLSPQKGTILAAIIADILTEGLSVVEITNFASFIVLIGDGMAYIASQRELNIVGEVVDSCSQE